MSSTYHPGTDLEQSGIVRAWATWIDDMFRITREVLEAQRRFAVTLLGAAEPVVEAARQAGEQTVGQAVGQAQRVVRTTADVTRDADRADRGAPARGTVDPDPVPAAEDGAESGAEDQVADLAEVLDDVTEDLEVDTDLTAVVVVDTEADQAAGATDGSEGTDGSQGKKTSGRGTNGASRKGDDASAPPRSSSTRTTQRTSGKPRRPRAEG